MAKKAQQAATHPGIILLIIAFAQFMVVLDATIVNVALPSIQHALHFSVNSLQWVVTAYTLTFGGFLLLGGRLADLWGRRRIFMAGLTLFSLASLMAGFATSEMWLITARAIQGLGGAMLSPSALSILLDTFREGRERNRALGVWGGVASAGAAFGLVFGGVLTQYAGWEWIFYVNVPVGALTLLATLRFIHESRSDEKVESDAIGALTVTGGLILLVYALVKAPAYGWGSARTLGEIAASLVLLAFFVYNERRHEHPLVPLSIFRVGNIAGANLTSMPVAISLFSMFFYVSIYMQELLGFSPLKAGLASLPVAATIGASAGIGSQLINRISYKRILMVSPLFLIGGLFWLGHIPVHGTYLHDILPPMIVIGIGMGTSFVAMTVAATAGVPRSESGLASGLINTSQQIGGALGLAILTAVATSRTTSVMTDAHGNPAQLPHALVEGFHWAFFSGAGIAVLSLIFAATLLHSIPPDASDKEAAKAAQAPSV